MPSRRIAQVNELLRRELTRLLARSFEPPKDAFVTVEEVRVSADLSYARVFVSVLPAARATRVVQLLEEQRGEFGRELGARLVMKRIPKLQFVEDSREERASKIYELLDPPGTKIK